MAMVKGKEGKVAMKEERLKGGENAVSIHGRSNRCFIIRSFHCTLSKA